MWNIVSNGNDLSFDENGVAAGRLYLKAGGNVGIGNTAPGNTLTLGTAGNHSASFGIADVQTTSAGTSNLTPTCSRINITATGTYTLLTGSLPIGTLIFIYNASGSAPTIKGYYRAITLNSYTCVFAIKDENGNWELQMPAT